MSRLLVKIGGAQLEEPAARAGFAQAVAAARGAGREVVLVHGGGRQVSAFGEALGLPTVRREGLRVTDAATADVVAAVLAGLVNKALVADLGRAGVRAVGLCGADGQTFSARRLAPKGIDIGYVGAVQATDPALCHLLLAAGMVPVLASVAPLHPDVEGPDDHLYNINADHVVGPLAAALGCDTILFLTDVEGVLDAGRVRLPRLSAAECGALRADGVLSGGMIPKVEAALDALALAPHARVKIAPAAGRDAIQAALSEDVGTLFTA